MKPFEVKATCTFGTLMKATTTKIAWSHQQDIWTPIKVLNLVLAFTGFQIVQMTMFIKSVFLQIT
jgi:hypothetical protein